MLIDNLKGSLGRDGSRKRKMNGAKQVRKEAHRSLGALFTHRNFADAFGDAEYIGATPEAVRIHRRCAHYRDCADSMQWGRTVPPPFSRKAVGVIRTDEAGPRPSHGLHE